jgi:biopolymer transport protein ExbD
MSRRTTPSVKEDVTANLIPMIDIMFLLLLFFMLGADMTERERAELVLPEADMVNDADQEKSVDDQFRTTINVSHKPDEGGFSCPLNAKGGICRDMEHWQILIRSVEFDLETVKPEIVQLSESALEAEIDPVAGKRLSKRKIIIRGDKGAPYGHVQALIQACGLSGIYKIEVGAAQPPKG